MSAGICVICGELFGHNVDECCADTPSGSFQTCKQLVNPLGRQNDSRKNFTWCTLLKEQMLKVVFLGIFDPPQPSLLMWFVDAL